MASDGTTFATALLGGGKGEVDDLSERGKDARSPESVGLQDKARHARVAPPAHCYQQFHRLSSHETIFLVHFPNLSHFCFSINRISPFSPHNTHLSRYSNYCFIVQYVSIAKHNSNQAAQQLQRASTTSFRLCPSPLSIENSLGQARGTHNHTFPLAV